MSAALKVKKYRDAGSTDMFGSFARLAFELIGCEETFIATPEDLETSLSSGGVSFSSAREAACSILDDRVRPVVVVIDNLEDLAIQIDDPGLQSCIRGLLYLMGNEEFGATSRSPFRIRKCFPSEMIPRLHELSASPERDFRRSLTIRWIAPEIISMAARRWWLYLDLYRKPSDRSVLPDLDQLADASHAKDFVRSLLPDHVTNGYGHQETGLGYLMRHTQLLPRHLIGLINTTLQHSGPGPVDESTLRGGVAAGEQVLVQGILASYRNSYQPPSTALQMLKGRVPNVLSRGEFQKIYNQTEIKKTTKMQFPEFVELLVGMGAMGPVADETDYYYEAHFFYTHEGSLNLSVDPNLLLAFHPLFSQYLNCIHMKSEKREPKAVYPYGSDPEGTEDYRLGLIS